MSRLSLIISIFVFSLILTRSHHVELLAILSFLDSELIRVKTEPYIYAMSIYPIVSCQDASYESKNQL